MHLRVRWGGVKGKIKRFFMRRIRRVYASGISQARLAKNLGFVGEIKLTGGCGILNYVKQPKYEPRQDVKNFLYVGRLAEEKNLKLLIEAFNDMPELKLKIIGFGSKESELKVLAKDNIIFTGAIDNKDLSQHYCKADVFVLPSNAEPWGLVVEEALNNGCPVIVSDRVGCREALVSDKVGIVFQHDSIEALKDIIRKITETDYYNYLRKNISMMNFDCRARKQVETYI